MRRSQPFCFHRLAGVSLAISLLLAVALGCESSSDSGCGSPPPDMSSGGGGGGSGSEGPVAHGPMDEATETNVAPIRCDDDADCSGGECVRADPADPSGSCMRAGTGPSGSDEDAGLLVMTR